MLFAFYFQFSYLDSINKKQKITFFFFYENNIRIFIDKVFHLFSNCFYFEQKKRRIKIRFCFYE
jgi:hypothetical protein